jgi:small GTP-binding protein
MSIAEELVMIVSEVNIKLAILGTARVGKTSITQSYLDKEVPSMYIPTIGSNISRKEYKLETVYIRVNLWDIGGQRSFNPLNPTFFNNIDAAFLAFDLSDPKESLNELQKVYLKQIKESSPKCRIIFLGNKSDLVKPENLGSLMSIVNQDNLSEYKLIFTSAKTQDNINEAFELMIYSCLKQFERSKFFKFKTISNDFIKFIGKTEEDIKAINIDLDKIDSNTLQSKITPEIRKNRIENEFPKAKNVEKTIQIPTNIENLLQVDEIRENIIRLYHKNINFVDQLILDLKSTPINLLIEKIDAISSELINLNNDFKLKLDALTSFDAKMESDNNS